MKKKIELIGYLVEELGEYNFMTGIANGEKFDQSQLLGIILDEISDQKFNKILAKSTRAEIELEAEGIKLIVLGKILGGSDPTKPLRHQGKKFKPRQNLTILLDQKLDKDMDEMIKGEKVKLIISL